jgi:hypothetical protein
MKTIFETKLDQFGISGSVDVREMDTGELRAKLAFPDSSMMLSRMPANAQGAWNNAHSHNSLEELIIVKSGWIIWATQTINQADGTRSDGVAFKRYNAGDSFNTPANRIAHCLYSSPGTELFVVVHKMWKPGDGNPDKGGYDWWPEDWLSDRCKQLSHLGIMML